MLPRILQGKFKMLIQFSVKKMLSKPSTQPRAEDEAIWSYVSRLKFFPFYPILLYFLLQCHGKERLFFENSPDLPDEKQEVAAWLLAFLGLVELLALLCAELAVSEPWPAAACAGVGAALSWSESGTWRAGWKVSCLVAVSSVPSQGSWAYVVEFPYLQLPKNLF